MWMDNWVLNTPKILWPKPILFRFFEAQTTCVVLSSSNNADAEVHVEECQKRGIPILRRKGGGGTVVLTPGCVVLTLAFYAKDLFSNKEYFEKTNSLWIQALEGMGIRGLATRGISDIALLDKKVAGTSVFRRKHLFVYQASLLVNANLELIFSLLKHPSREPDYRNGRSHEDFVTNLQAIHSSSTASEVATFCQHWFNNHADKWFDDVLLK